jgi:hypothetical protein
VLVQTIGDRAETEQFLAIAAADHLVAGVVGWAELTSGTISTHSGRSLEDASSPASATAYPSALTTGTRAAHSSTD